MKPHNADWSGLEDAQDSQNEKRKQTFPGCDLDPFDDPVDDAGNYRHIDIEQLIVPELASSADQGNSTANYSPWPNSNLELTHMHEVWANLEPTGMHWKPGIEENDDFWTKYSRLDQYQSELAGRDDEWGAGQTLFSDMPDSAWDLPDMNWTMEGSLDALLTNEGAVFLSDVPSIHAASDLNINTFDNDDRRWDATLSRLRAADQSFLYGVLTTKIFCRPSCASRRPSRRNVVFFPFPDAINAAIRAEFRPCKRCNPETLKIADKGVNGVISVLRMIITDSSETSVAQARDLKLQALAKEADLSPFHFQRVFKTVTQMTPGDFTTACQTLALQDALACQSLPDRRCQPVKSESETFQAYSRWGFRTTKKALGGMTPADYNSGAPHQDTLYANVESPAGSLCVAYSGKGEIHSILIEPEAATQLQARFLRLIVDSTHDEALHDCIRRIADESRDRDTVLPQELLPVLWRARLWLRLVNERVLRDGK